MLTRPLLLPLGTGGGATTIFHREPSSSFAILLSGECRLLVDLGFGVTHQVITLLGRMPKRIFITHNHADHAAELPVVALRCAKEGTPLTIFSESEVQRRLMRHRFFELRENGIVAKRIAQWVTVRDGVKTEVDDELALVPLRGRHSERSFGFILYFAGQPILGYSGDSGFDLDLYAKLSIASLMILDACASGSTEHASFDQIDDFSRSVGAERIFVTHYGRRIDAPLKLQYLRPGITVPL